MFLSNLREAGGISAAGGKIASGVLYRSAAPHQIGEQLTSWIQDSRITSIFDLRSSQETGYLPGFPETFGSATRTRMPLLEGAIGQLATLDDIYLPLVSQHADTWVQLARGILNSEASLVHCTAGKDRTGVGFALVLLAVGAEKDAVMEDYARSTEELSGTWLQTMSAQMSQHGVEMTEEMRTLMVGTSIMGLDAALDLARAEGSVSDYLLNNGLTRVELEALGEKLVVS